MRLQGKTSRFARLMLSVTGIAAQLAIGSSYSFSAVEAQPATATNMPAEIRKPVQLSAAMPANQGETDSTRPDLGQTGSVKGAAGLPTFAQGDLNESVVQFLKKNNDGRIPTLDDYQKLLTNPDAKKFNLSMPIGSGHYVMAMCLDLQNNLWVGTEGEGLYRFNPSEGTWTQFVATKTPPPDGNPPISVNAIECGMGDNYVYALACDRQGRVWIGHLNHGVSVFNGDKFQSYEVVAGLSRPNSLNGPLGERVFNIKVAPSYSNQGDKSAPMFRDALTGKDSPMSGSVWMCTSAGLAAYFPSTDSWSYVTRAEGMPSDQANSIAFGDDGTVYVATQCDGIAIATVEDKYQSWRQVARRAPLPNTPVVADLPDFMKTLAREKSATSPSSNNDNQSTRKNDALNNASLYPLTDNLPTTATGDGLPSNLINDILVAENGTVYAATTTGLAWSIDKGKTWKFMRGADYAEKVRLSIAGPPDGWNAKSGAILSEDYSTTLAEDSAGNILVGHRSKTGDVVTPNVNRVVSTTPKGYANVFLETPGCSYRGLYGEGISFNTNNQLQGSGGRLVLAVNPFGGNGKGDKEKAAIAFPSCATVPEEVIDKLTHRIQESIDNQVTTKSSPVALMTPDWTTQGSWLGRVGRYWMTHSAAVSPYDLYWGTGAANVKYVVQQGKPGTEPNDSLRYWISYNHTNDVRSLELTTPYLQSRVEKGLTSWAVDRRQSEWDDHGEVTSPSRQGPNVYFTIQIPNGQFCLSLYSNYGYGRQYSEPYRDYLLSAREHPKSQPLSDLSGFDSWAELARTRVTHHYGGVYSRFYVQGPRLITVCVDRNWSFNANLMGAFLDEIEPFPSIYYSYAEINKLQAYGNQPPANQFGRVLVLSKQACRSGIIDSTRINSVLISRYCQNLLAKHFAQSSGNINTQLYAASCFFWNAFDKFEKLQNDMGIDSSRKIEKSLRWDGSSNQYPFWNNDLIKIFKRNEASKLDSSSSSSLKE